MIPLIDGICRYSLNTVGATGLSLLLLLSQDAPQTEAMRDPVLEKFRKEEDDDLEKLHRELAEKHYKLGKWCETSKLMHRARYHYLRTISYSPDHENARKVLGFKKNGSSWTSVKDITFQVDRDEKIAQPENEAEITTAWKELQPQYQVIQQLRATLDLKLAEKAKAANLPFEEKRILYRIIQYWPDNAEARGKLKQIRSGQDIVAGENTRTKQIWLQPDTKKMMTSIKVTGPIKERSEEEKNITSPFLVFQSEHFRLVAELPQDYIQGYARNAEAGFRYILSMLPDAVLPNHEDQWPIRWYIFIGEDYKKVVESIIRVGPKEMAWRLKNASFRDGYRAFLRHVDLSERRNHGDLFYHVGAEYAADELFPKRVPWFREALAYTVTQDLNDTCHTTCLSDDRGSGVELVDHWRQLNAWRDLLAESVMMQEDPPAKKIFESSYDKLKSKGGVKAWSILQFLRQKEPGVFVTYLKDVSSGIDPVLSIERLYKMNDKQLDSEWRAWVLKTY